MHPHVQRYLAAKRGRGEVGDLAVEGRWALDAARRAGADVVAAFVCPALAAGSVAGAVEVGEKTMRRMVDRDGPDGVAALVRLPHRALDDVALGERTRVVVADGVDLPGNLGTIVRCADGAGAAAVLVTDAAIRIATSTVMKASMGTLLTVPVLAVDGSDARRWLRRHRFRVVAADPAASTSYREADYGGRVAIVVGSERQGLDAAWRAEADALVSIPMLGRADSLNVGHAAALLLYEALHRT
jgi:TrmH family RNA methyltransferase